MYICAILFSAEGEEAAAAVSVCCCSFCYCVEVEVKRRAEAEDDDGEPPAAAAPLRELIVTGSLLPGLCCCCDDSLKPLARTALIQGGEGEGRRESEREKAAKSSVAFPLETAKKMKKIHSSSGEKRKKKEEK